MWWVWGCVQRGFSTPYLLAASGRGSPGPATMMPYGADRLRPGPHWCSPMAGLFYLLPGHPGTGGHRSLVGHWHDAFVSFSNIIMEGVRLEHNLGLIVQTDVRQRQSLSRPPCTCMFVLRCLFLLVLFRSEWILWVGRTALPPSTGLLFSGLNSGVLDISGARGSPFFSEFRQASNPGIVRLDRFSSA